MIMQFKFEEYPEIAKKYKEYEKLRKKLYRTLHGSPDDAETLKKIHEFEHGDFPKMVFDIFNGKIEYVMVGHTKKTWSEVIGNDYSKLTDEQKETLANIVDGGFYVLLPREYYNDPYDEYPSCEN